MENIKYYDYPGSYKRIGGERPKGKNTPKDIFEHNYEGFYTRIGAERPKEKKVFEDKSEPKTNFWIRLDAFIKRIMKYPLMRLLRLLTFLTIYTTVCTILWNRIALMIAAVRRTSDAAIV
jgi:hypothetical protein